MSIPQVLSLLCGIAFFLFGMSLMGDGLKKLSGDKLEPILYRLSGTTFRGLLLGTGVTAVIQSSCATAVMVVGFVNSKMMQLRQGIGVILGAILGTSITGWVICLSYVEGAGGLASLISTSTLTSVVAVVGILLRTFSKKVTHKNLGDIMLGFSILMFGMSTMSGAVSTLRDQPWFTSALTRMANPVLGILVGALFTALLQSASAAVGIVQALSFTGAMNFDAAFPLLLGITFGASAPVMLAAIGANANGKRTAFVYPLSTGIGAIITAIVFYAANAVLHFPFISQVMNPFSMAFVNTVMRLLMIVLLFPMVSLIERIVTGLVKNDAVEDDDKIVVNLEERFLQTPPLAIEQSRIAIRDMAVLVEESLEEALDLFTKFDELKFEDVKRLEDGVDKYEDALGTYLMQITGKSISPQQSADVSVFLHALTDLERISDHALNLAESAKEMHDKQIRFSGKASAELNVIIKAATRVVHVTVQSLLEDDLTMANHVEPLEQVIDELCEAMKLNHVERLQKGICTVLQGFVFNDMLTDFERISDHCSNIAIAMIALHDNTFETHVQLKEIRRKNSKDYLQYYYKYQEEFALEEE